MEQDKIIIMTGDASSGYQFVGPFNSYEEAVAYAERHTFGFWEGCTLTAPEGE